MSIDAIAPLRRAAIFFAETATGGAGVGPGMIAGCCGGGGAGVGGAFLRIVFGRTGCTASAASGGGAVAITGAASGGGGVTAACSSSVFGGGSGARACGHS